MTSNAVAAAWPVQTAATTPLTSWREQAACVGSDISVWFDKDSGTAQQICEGCRVRAECLYDAVAHEPVARGHQFGVYGGLTGPQRRRLPRLPKGQAAAIAVLHEYLTTTATRPSTERTRPDMTTDTALVAQTKAEDLPVGRLLTWGDEHPDPDVRDQAARARAALTGLRRRHAADQELTAITTEAGQLEKRLAELRAREAELAPAKPKRKPPVRDYDTRTVRAWADASGVECPRVGQIPKRVLAAWRASLPQAGGVQ